MKLYYTVLKILQYKIFKQNAYEDRVVGRQIIHRSIE